MIKLLEKQFPKGTIVTNSQQDISKKTIQKYFEKKGFLNTEILWSELPCPHLDNCTNVVLEIDKKEKVKIYNITFTGNKNVTKKKLKKLMRTKSKVSFFKNPFAITQKKFLINEKFETDKQRILAYYRTLGYLDAKILEEKIKAQKNGDLEIKIRIKEGKSYTFGNITWRGNSKYSTEVLNEVLDIKKGDVYNTIITRAIKF